MVLNFVSLDFDLVDSLLVNLMLSNFSNSFTIFSLALYIPKSDGAIYDPGPGVP